MDYKLGTPYPEVGPSEVREHAEIRTKKILFAPHEIGGQMKLMTEELRRRGFFATSATFVEQAHGHICDIELDLATLGRVRKHLNVLTFFMWAAVNFDIFHFFWGSSLLSYRWFRRLDLPILKRLGKQIYVHFRGIELVDLAYFDYLRGRTAGLETSEPPLSRPDQRRLAQDWRRYSEKMLVSEPDLFRVVPEAVLVQQAIDLDYWSGDQRPNRDLEARQVVRIAHAPSMRRKKGTEFVIEAVEALRNEGHLVELILIENVPFYQVKDLYAGCDIGVDQVLYGWYGKVSIELMALGKPVVCFIDPELRSHRPDLPIVSSNTGDLKSALLGLVESRERRVALGQQGLEYVRRHHDVKAIIDQCLEIYSCRR